MTALIAGECRKGLLQLGIIASVTLCIGINIPVSVNAGVAKSINKRQSAATSISLQSQNKTVHMSLRPKTVVDIEPRNADFTRESKSREVQRLADWIAGSGDNDGLPYIVIDKTEAKIFVFNKASRFLAASPALIGLAKGDESVPGIGEREISEIRPEERTTPAGRFVAWLGYDLEQNDVLWVEYDTSVTLHRVIINKPEERRLQRLATRTPKDNRITYGCINVPSKFFDRTIKTVFDGTDGIVYILPEKKSTHEIFPTYYDVD
ncbi:MAG TPA: hypothetical protein VHO84_11365 [Syntrophorhabdaceae bacterium]|nr:hypothetical protein [Syntrophorhabdaceae bacterium]